MSDALQQAFEIAQQQPEDVQTVIAQLIFEAIDSEQRWDKLLTHPKSSLLLEQLGDLARKEYAAGYTHSVDELLS